MATSGWLSVWCSPWYRFPHSDGAGDARPYTVDDMLRLLKASDHR